MKAIRIHGFGTPDGVSFDEIERPEVGPADALVQIESASVNPLMSRCSYFAAARC
jgi:NADPH:quinone reductase-like Zn-dependent oxidoreductase